jgi:hypothetical protein
MDGPQGQLLDWGAQQQIRDLRFLDVAGQVGMVLRKHTYIRPESHSDFWFIGDYIDSATSNQANDPFAYLIWTDRSDKNSEFDLEDDVWMEKVPLP